VLHCVSMYGANAMCFETELNWRKFFFTCQVPMCWTAKNFDKHPPYSVFGIIADASIHSLLNVLMNEISAVQNQTVAKSTVKAFNFGPRCPFTIFPLRACYLRKASCRKIKTMRVVEKFWFCSLLVDYSSKEATKLAWKGRKLPWRTSKVEGFYGSHALENPIQP
jgi:hypothetical protein